MCNFTERSRITAQVDFGQQGANVPEDTRSLAVPGCNKCQVEVPADPPCEQMPPWQASSTFPPCFPIYLHSPPAFLSQPCQLPEGQPTSAVLWLLPLSQDNSVFPSKKQSCTLFMLLDIKTTARKHGGGKT